MNDNSKKLIEKVNLKSAEENNILSQDEAFLSLAYDSIQDVMDQNELIISGFDNENFGMKISGYDLVDEDTVTLFISDYNASSVGNDITQTEIRNWIAKLISFVDQARKGLHRHLDESSYVYRISQYICDSYRNIRIFNLVFITCKKYSDKEITDVQIGSKKTVIKVFDVDALNELNAFNDEEIGSVNIDVRQTFGESINAIKSSSAGSEDEDQFDVYMFFMKAKHLATLYGKYGYALLEGNVRAYLKKTQKTNKGILETIENHPGYFVAYNNGLSTVADGAVINEGRIEALKGWKIVNGGQTTATIYEALKEGKLGDDVEVPVKLTLIRRSDNSEMLISDIARYANTQSKVNESDLSSNEKFFIEIEKFSRTVSVPSSVVGSELEKWFFERIRGQYNLEKSRNDKNAFAKEFPSKKKFEKKELARAVMAWEQEPYTVSLGGEKNFITYNSRIRSNAGTFTVDRDYYKNSIGAVILYKEVTKVVKGIKFGGYQANVIAYVSSLISFLAEKKLNLDKIWKEQGISDEMKEIIEYLAKDVYKIITDTPENNTNVAMYCRKPECWEKVKEYDFGLQIPGEYIQEKVIGLAQRTGKTNIGSTIINLDDVTESQWWEIAKWGKETELIAGNERKMAGSMARLVKSGKKPTEKQENFAKSILQKAVQNGFIYNRGEN